MQKSCSLQIGVHTFYLVSQSRHWIMGSARSRIHPRNILCTLLFHKMFPNVMLPIRKERGVHQPSRATCPALYVFITSAKTTPTSFFLVQKSIRTVTHLLFVQKLHFLRFVLLHCCATLKPFIAQSYGKVSMHAQIIFGPQSPHMLANIRHAATFMTCPIW